MSIAYRARPPVCVCIVVFLCWIVDYKHTSFITSCVGPAAYNLPSEIPPAPRIGERLERDLIPDTPGPNKYQLPSSIRPASGKSIAVRRELKSAHVTPPPNVYTFQRPRTASAHFTYRSFPEKSESVISKFFSFLTNESIIIATGEQRPGPKYKPGHADIPTSPEYSCRNQCKPVYPDVLQYPENGKSLSLDVRAKTSPQQLWMIMHSFSHHRDTRSRRLRIWQGVCRQWQSSLLHRSATVIETK